MEEVRSSVSSLSLLDFDEWVNIPRPVIQALMVFKQCFVDHTRKIADFGNEFENLNNKVQIKLRNMNEVLASTNDALRNQQEVIMKKVKERCEFLSNDFTLFKNKINEDNNSRQKMLNESLYEMKEQVHKCVKTVNGMMTEEEISQLINEKNVMLQQIIVNEVRDQQVRPAIDRVMSEQKSANE